MKHHKSTSTSFALRPPTRPKRPIIHVVFTRLQISNKFPEIIYLLPAFCSYSGKSCGTFTHFILIGIYEFLRPSPRVSVSLWLNFDCIIWRAGPQYQHGAICRNVVVHLGRRKLGERGCRLAAALKAFSLWNSNVIAQEMGNCRLTPSNITQEKQIGLNFVGGMFTDQELWVCWV